MHVRDYRLLYRSTVIPPAYDGTRNIVLNISTCMIMLVGSALLTNELSVRGFAFALAGLFVFAFFEYAFHRWVSHRKSPLLGASYRRHTGQHHGFFNHQDMWSDQLRDYHVTVMPTAVIVVYYLLFFAVFILPLWLTVGRSPAFAFSTGIAFGLFQLDILHYYYHLPSEVRLSRTLDHFAFFRDLKARHTAHHNPRLMRQQGFNLTIPVFDWLFGTSGKTGTPATASAGPTRSDSHGS